MKDSQNQGAEYPDEQLIAEFYAVQGQPPTDDYLEKALFVVAHLANFFTFLETKKQR